MSKSKEYSNGEVTIVWKPDLCIHSAICAKGLPRVFQPRERPWIKIDAAETQALVEQVKACPSGALSYYMNDEKSGEPEMPSDEIKIEVRQNGPLVVHGTLHVLKTDGTTETRTRLTTFCRCGASSNKPFCDGAHKGIEFKG